MAFASAALAGDPPKKRSSVWAVGAVSMVAGCGLLDCCHLPEVELARTGKKARKGGLGPLKGFGAWPRRWGCQADWR